MKRCYWCEESFTPHKGTTYEDEYFVEEIGEFWSEKLQDSVVGHPDCVPGGIDTIFEGNNPEWKMA